MRKKNKKKRIFVQLIHKKNEIVLESVCDVVLSVREVLEIETEVSVYSNLNINIIITNTILKIIIDINIFYVIFT